MGKPDKIRVKGILSLAVGLFFLILSIHLSFAATVDIYDTAIVPSANSKYSNQSAFWVNITYGQDTAGSYDCTIGLLSGVNTNTNDQAANTIGTTQNSDGCRVIALNLTGCSTGGCSNNGDGRVRWLGSSTFSGQVAKYNIQCHTGGSYDISNAALTGWTDCTTGKASPTLFVNNVTINASNIPPTTPSPEINSSLGTNYSFEDLNCYDTLIDQTSGDKINVTLLWYKNSVLNATLYYNNSYSNGTAFTAVLGAGNTSVGENWSCSMRLHDGKDFSPFANSTKLLIRSDPVTSFSVAYPSSGCSQNYGCTTPACSACTYCHFNASVNTISNLGCTGQTATTSFWTIVNDGDLTLGINFTLNQSLGATISFKADTDSNPSGAAAITTTPYKICTSIVVGANCTVWGFADYTSAVAGIFERQNLINST